MNLKYALIGMGAVGGYYGSKLALAGHDIHFLLRGDYGHVRSHGYSVDSVKGSYHLDDLNIYSSSSQMPECDVVLVAMKTTSNHLLPELLKPLLKANTLVVLMQNGIGVEADVEKMIPGIQLAAGVAFINCAKTGPGEILHKGYGHVTLCDYSLKHPEVLSQVAADFEGAGVPALVADYAESRWKKAILNLATNGMTVVHNCRCDELISNPETCAVVKALMLEGIRVANACGVVALTPELADKMIATTGTTHFATSMKYDFDHHLPMEIEYLYSTIIREADAHAIAVPELKKLERMLKEIA